MSEKIQKNTWGGKREGAGRPSTNSKLYAFRFPEHIANLVNAQKNKTEYVKECILEYTKKKGNNPFAEIIPATQLKETHLPFYDISIVAGFPIPLDNDERAQDINLARMLCPYPESAYLIRVQGDSMIDAGVMSGDILIVDKSNRNPSEHEVAVCEFNGEYTLKRFVKEDGVGWLVPANPNYPRIRIEEHDDFSIWGTVTYIIHKPKP